MNEKNLVGIEKRERVAYGPWNFLFDFASAKNPRLAS